MTFEVQRSMMSRRQVLKGMGLLGLGAMGLPILGGCGGGSGGGGGNGGGGETIRIASIRWSAEDIFFNAVQYGQELEIKRLRDEEGINVEFTVSAASDESEQVNAMQTQLDSGIQGILHTPWRGEAMIPLLNQANERNIPVVTHNLIVPEAPQNHVAVDNVEAGRLAAETLVRRLEELRGPDWAEEEGLIIATRCFTTQAFDIARFTGFEEVFNPILEANPNLTLEVFETNCNADEARTGVEDLLSRYGNDALRAVWSIEGTGAVGGIIPALQNRNLMFDADDPKHIPISSIDGTGPEMEAISRGQLDHASQQPTIGEGIMSMRLLVETIRNDGQIPEALRGPVVYEDAQEVWQPLDVVEDDRFDGQWYQLPIVEIPRDIPPDSPDSWPNQIEGEVEGASSECSCGVVNA
ncbi:Periplasmic binding protein domain [Rubrobacter radiotolerans]|uniref:Periplasmic binding protein domain n=1 Tax=Rubrobacter radiotolerans TaxID=42256 RepID=A0A023X6V1_RUBRA|nr:sugar ABC transporter substrate-binding protein [Rubrobacter radiotolerans]AHY47745.1 Periplasmic binding protein domain [Rubrobacter radiotolerans]MDX5895221.1 sugar ABC transporter substrate-binding protein [Rubrobacter radiotolerans]SMC07673.1 ribose transport system substrate-binding protein [Rubrobacter radiotolerans DSM 5868]